MERSRCRAEDAALGDCMEALREILTGKELAPGFQAAFLHLPECPSQSR